MKETPLSFLENKGIKDLEITLSKEDPKADAVSGKFMHIYRKS